MGIQGYVDKVSRGDALSAEEAEEAFGHVMAGRASDVEVAALLTALRARGEAPSEVAGGVRALREAMVSLPVDAGGVVDTCGTGGGSLTTFNISTVSALAAVAGGVRVAKHGNRSYSSRCGSADVLEAAGIELELPVERLAAVFREVGFVFMYAPAFHPAMRHVASVRNELGVATIFNLLGPLTNPAGVRRQVVGVSDPGLLELVAGGLEELGHERALVVHGEPGLDELSPLGPTRGIMIEEGTTRSVEIRPEDFGWGKLDGDELAGGSPHENLAVMERVLKGRGAPAARAAVALNAGAALWAGGAAEDLASGVDQAREILRDGAGWDVLEALRRATARAAEAAPQEDG